MAFDEEVAFKISQESYMDDDAKEQEAPILEDHDQDNQEICLDLISKL